MKSSTKRVLAVAALMAATLCASSTSARKAASPTPQERNISIRVPDRAQPRSFETQVRDGKIAGMTVVKKDGSRMALKAQSRPTCATSCPAGQTLSCWENEAEMMSMCVCTGVAAGETGVASIFTASW